MMKKMIYVLACITSILFFACSSNESIIVEENKAVEMEFLSKSIKEDTRVTIVPENDQFSINWEATGDAVGIFANAIDSNGAITVLGSNKRYNATPRDIVSECDFVPNETTDKIYWRYHRNHNLYAYFPHTEGQDNPSAIQTTLPAHQTQTVPDPLAHVSELSFMTAAAIEREMNNFEQVNFQFTSLYSLIELNIKTKPSDNQQEIIKIALHTTDAPVAINKGTINIIDNTFDIQSGGNGINLTLSEEVVLNDVSDATFYIVVAPGTHSASSIFIELVTADNKATKIPIEQAVTFKPGICHAINLELNSADLIAKEYAHEIIVTPDSEATSQYVVTDLETGFLYTDRTYTLTNVPEKYFGWQMATTPANTRLAGTIEAKSDGKVYIITRYNKRTIMANSGWVAETPQREEDGVPIKETSTGNIVIIWSRTVAKGDIVTIPGELSDTSFGGFTPIAPRIILRDAP